MEVWAERGMLFFPASISKTSDFPFFVAGLVVLDAGERAVTWGTKCPRDTGGPATLSKPRTALNNSSAVGFAVLDRGRPSLAISAARATKVEIGKKMPI